jgi:hypothetical protein
MFRSIAQVASVAALMAIGIPPYSAGAVVGTPSLQSDDAIVLVRERWRGDWGSRGWRGGHDGKWGFRCHDKWWGWRGGHDGKWGFRGHDKWWGSRVDGPWHGFRRRRDD